MSDNAGLPILVVENHVVRAMRVRDNIGDLSVVYTGSRYDRSSEIGNVCHIRDLDTLQVC